MKKIILVAGARPNFMKIAPIVDAIRELNGKGDQLDFSLVHTGQHYDDRMSGDFFNQLNIPTPDVNLEAGGGSQAEQTAAIMVRFEKYLTGNRADLVVVVGDVTSTLACSIVAKKLGIRVAHVEGGIRSGDLSMPEEINRLVTDSISDYFFTTTEWAGANLIREGKSQEQIFLVGNTMIDSLRKHEYQFRKPEFWERFALHEKKYFVMTLHRPSNVDDGAQLMRLLKAIDSGSQGWAVIFPVHPRTAKVIGTNLNGVPSIKCVDPLGYLEFNHLVKNAAGVVTDSGGITEETTVMSIPCITLRNTTERPETVSIGTNELIGQDESRIPIAMKAMALGKWKEGRIPELWDGAAGRRIVEHILNSIP